ncbi:MAG: sulfatase-like hydrolase/transferase [Epsilonproteobacteria bacterium]|nr:sulfatase-like hydrolase/transferase [Campylobacterota bacterium]
MELFKQIFRYYLYMISIFFLGRLALFITYFDRLTPTDSSYWLTFLYGLRIDSIVANMFLVIPLLLLAFSPKILSRFINVFLKYYFLFLIGYLIFIEIATFPFMAQYDVRPNYLFVEYLEYPQEVFSMIIADYKLELLIAFIIIGSFGFFFLRHYKGFESVFETPWWKRALLFLPLGALLFIGIRSSFGHRPANISDAMYSSNRILNEITKNSLYSVGYAIYANKEYEKQNITKEYGKMPIDEAKKRFLSRLNIHSEDTKYFLSRVEPSHFDIHHHKNIVIFIQESLGAQFVEALGGEKGITPHLNQLAQEGILFTQLYSNGTRSVRGIAGLVAGNFSIPGKGVVKRNKSQNDYFTLAKAVKPYGYHTSFIYGGESRFDNMKGWFLGNGFDEVIDEEKFKDPKFVGTWGVCDDEVVQRANKEFKKLYEQKEKFASVIFSTSNHTPFDFPKEKITPLKGEKLKSVKNAIKYADFAIGKLIELAKKEGYYKDTIFVIAADHNVRVYGDDIVPVNMFHIPGVILGSDIKPQKYSTLSTQPDVLATTLDLAGIEAKTPIMGHSIFSDKKTDLSLMQFNDTYALRVGEKVAVLQPHKQPKTFLYKQKHLIPTTHDTELEKDLLAFIIVLDYIYQNRLYQ